LQLSCKSPIKPTSTIHSISWFSTDFYGLSVFHICREMLGNPPVIRRMRSLLIACYISSEFKHMRVNCDRAIWVYNLHNLVLQSAASIMHICIAYTLSLVWFLQAPTDTTYFLIYDELCHFLLRFGYFFALLQLKCKQMWLTSTYTVHLLMWWNWFCFGLVGRSGQCSANFWFCRSTSHLSEGTVLPGINIPL
jgi:hypothetical protein